MALINTEVVNEVDKLVYKQPERVSETEVANAKPRTIVTGNYRNERGEAKTTTSYAYSPSPNCPIPQEKYPTQAVDNTKAALCYNDNETTPLLVNGRRKRKRCDRKCLKRLRYSLLIASVFALALLCCGIAAIIIHQQLANIKRHLTKSYSPNGLKYTVLLSEADGSLTKTTKLSVPDQVLNSMAAYSFTWLPVKSTTRTSPWSFVKGISPFPDLYCLSGSSMTFNLVNMSSPTGCFEVIILLNNSLYRKEAFTVDNITNIDYTCALNSTGFYTLITNTSSDGQVIITTRLYEIDVDQFNPTCVLNHSHECHLPMTFGMTNFIVLSFEQKDDFEVHLDLVECLELYVFLFVIILIVIIIISVISIPFCCCFRRPNSKVLSKNYCILSI